MKKLKYKIGDRVWVAVKNFDESEWLYVGPVTIANVHDKTLKMMHPYDSTPPVGPYLNIVLRESEIKYRL